jgi:hypothetical protein
LRDNILFRRKREIKHGLIHEEDIENYNGVMQLSHPECRTLVCVLENRWFY